MAKRTGWYYSSRATDRPPIAHYFSAPLERGRLHTPACGDEGVVCLGRELRHESHASERCLACVAAVGETEPLAEDEVDVEVADEYDEAR